MYFWGIFSNNVWHEPTHQKPVEGTEDKADKNDPTGKNNGWKIVEENPAWFSSFSIMRAAERDVAASSISPKTPRQVPAEEAAVWFPATTVPERLASTTQRQPLQSAQEDDNQAAHRCCFIVYQDTNWWARQTHKVRKSQNPASGTFCWLIFLGLKLSRGRESAPKLHPVTFCASENS